MPFIEGLMELTALETEGHRVLAVYAQRLGQDLAKLLADRPQVLSERMLIAHCLYWWNAFGKGYLFELMVFADLTAEGIPFHAHDLRRREERYSPEDLVITSLRSVQSLLRSIGVERSEIPQSGALQWHGDVKTSTYFLYVVRSFPLRHDFYITRLFVTETNVWRWAVLLTPIMWKALDGDTQPATLEEAGRLLPAVLEVQTRGGTLMVVDYALWKTKVKAQQHRKEENPNGKDVG